MTSQNKRDRLIDAAAALFHKNGTGATSLADIAKHADIPIGNVYYYFKTKEELAIAVVSKHKEQFAAAYGLLDEAFDNPRQRLLEAVGYFDRVREEYTRHGCPISKMIEDSAGEKDTVSKAAAQVLADFVDWAAKQFSLLGHPDSNKVYATSLMIGIQGGVVMARAFQDPQVISDEIARLTVWLQNLPNRKIQIGKAFLKAPESTTTAA